MSQKKVDEYKESKKNRKEEIAKQKRNELLRRWVARAVIAVLLIGIVVGIVVTIRNKYKEKAAEESAAADMYQESAFLLQDFADIQGSETASAEESASEASEEASEASTEASEE